MSGWSISPVASGEEVYAAKQALRDSREERLQAKEKYLAALVRARKAGLSNVVIAKEVGVTEAAIRRYLQRNAPEYL